uniref:Enoyl-[acyl-carrier-protein] reductase, mitochondrial n=1 Tax=Clastoptera arizonana TaxID=38151 RepID=A0A1B6DLD6_9HEMI
MAIRLRKIVSIFVLNQMFNSNLIMTKHWAGHNLRFNSSTSILSKKLVMKEFGDPIKVVSLEEEILELPKTNEVCIKMLLASVNPADINTIQGVYPIKPDLPAVPGSEGIGEVVAVGPNVKHLNAGDKVIPNVEAAGTWRSHALYKEEHLLKVPNDIDIISLSGIMVNPSTAYRMLKDFVNLKPGDAIIQNGANSAAGQNIIQLCKAWNISTLNIVRNRPNINDLKMYLENLGATHVITEEELRTSNVGKTLKAKLALNCVGGKNALNVLRLLDHGGTMVTYGGMSRDPVTIPTSSLIFKDIKVKGFWMTRWHGENRNSSKQSEMFEDLFNLMRKGDLRPPVYRFVKLKDYREAIMNTMNVQGFTNAKYVINFSI